MRSPLYIIAHIVFGIITVLSALISQTLPLVFFFTFTAYETSEYVKKHDTLYLEFREYGIGLALGFVLVLLLAA